MKKSLLIIALLPFLLHAQGSWIQKSNFTGTSRAWANTFVIGLKGYLVGGGNGSGVFNDIWEYDQVTNIWTQKSSFIGNSRARGICFAIGSKGYYGNGNATPNSSNGTFYPDFWEWDQATNTWTQKANSGTGREACVSFTINGKGYMGTGWIAGGLTPSQYIDDFWEYDPGTNTWAAKANFGGTGRWSATGVSIGNKGYVATGYTGGGTFHNDCWEYDQPSNAWTQKANLTAGARNACSGFALGGKFYLGTGNNGSTYFSSFYEYDPAANVWNTCTSFPGVSRNGAVGFAIGSKGYIGTGNNGSTYYNDIWEYEPNPVLLGTWVQKADIPMSPTRTWGTGFSIGSKGYYCLGATTSFTYYNDVWEWDQATNVWTQKANYTGSSRTLCAAFSIGSKGYIGTGGLYGSGTKTQEFYEFDPVANTWTPKANFPGAARYMATGFSIGSKGYIGMGNAGGKQNDLWEWDQATNTWSAKASLPSTAREGAMGFSIGAKGYIACGSPSSGQCLNDFWEWDQATNTWTQRANVGGSPRCFGIAFSIGNKGFVGAGSCSTYYNDFWEWDQGSNTWIQRANVGGGPRSSGVGFAIGNFGYATTGGGSPSNLYKDLWEYSYCAAPPYTVSQTSVTVSGGNDGTATVTPQGGATPFTYSWSTNPVQTTATATGLSVGNYNVIVTDATGCSATSTVTITGPQPLSVNMTQVDVSCNGYNNGSAMAIPAGGTTPYSYLWNTTATTQSLAGLYAGTYTVIVTDALSASVTKTVTIMQPNPLSAQTSAINTLCGTNNGQLTANVSGGTTPYSYFWDNGKTTQVNGSLSPGAYVITVVDSKGCTVIHSATVGSIKPNYNLAFSANPQAGNVPMITAFNNTTPNPGKYDFAWTFGDGGTSTSGAPTVFHTYNYNGTFNVTLVATDTLTGCTDTLTKPGYIYTTGGTVCTHTAVISPAGPISGCLGTADTLSCNTDTSFTYQWNYNSAAISGATGSTLAVTQTGYYSVTIFQNNCPVNSAAVFVNFNTPPQAPSIIVNGSMVACQGGSVTLSSSSSPAGTYLWSPGGQTTQSIVTTSAGAYAVTVYNSNGCSATASDTVSSGVASLPICIVTVDSTSTKNQIVWTKPVTAAIDSFKIYREIASAYKLVGAVPYSSLSTFVDNTTGVNPKITAYKYKISVVDTCGDESTISGFHRTIHLSISPAIPCGYNLMWNDYVGVPVTQYRIMRDSAGTGWKALDSVSFGNTSWTDINCYPSQDTIAYRLEIDPQGGCVISIKDPQPMTSLNTSKSNVQQNFQVATSVNQLPHVPVITILPNPSSGLFNVRSDMNIVSIEVMNLLGERISASPQISYTKAEFDLSDKEAGVYLMRVNTLNGSTVRKIVLHK